MTFEQKVFQAFNVINEDYSGIISLESIGLYHHLMWLDHDIFKGHSISYAYILDSSKLTKQSLDKNIEMLIAVGLVQRLERKDAFDINIVPAELSEQEKIKLIEELCCTGIMHPTDRQRHLDEVAKRLQFREQRKKSALEPKDYDFSAVKRPDAPINIVRYYYQKLSQIFGGVYTSGNEKREAKNLGELMKRWGDTPEATRKMLDLILVTAKAKKNFKEVSSLALYGNLRNWAHYSLNSSLSPKDENPVMENVKFIYDRYTAENKMTPEAAIAELRQTFSEMVIQKFLEGKDAKSISIHQGRMPNL